MTYSMQARGQAIIFKHSNYVCMTIWFTYDVIHAFRWASSDLQTHTQVVIMTTPRQSSDTGTKVVTMTIVTLLDSDKLLGKINPMVFQNQKSSVIAVHVADVC